MTSTHTLRLGTRGSLLARTQSQLVADALEKTHPGLVVELQIFKTSGDLITDRPLHELGGKGLFTKELELALLDGRIDFAVHSFKDVPVTMPLVEQAEADLHVAAVPPREDTRDVLVAADPGVRRVEDLPRGGRVGTGSLRRRSQLLAARPDLRVEPVRGNIDTRLRKLREGEFDAILLAAAGLRRAGLFDESAGMTLVDPDALLPAPGQGALALQCRRNDARTTELLAAMNDPQTAVCVAAERALVARLRGDCHSPIAALAVLESGVAAEGGGGLLLKAAVGARGGGPPVVRAEAGSAGGKPEAAAAAVFDILLAKGAMELLHGGA